MFNRWIQLTCVNEVCVDNNNFMKKLSNKKTPNTRHNQSIMCLFLLRWSPVRTVAGQAYGAKNFEEVSLSLQRCRQWLRSPRLHWTPRISLQRWFFLSSFASNHESVRSSQKVWYFLLRHIIPCIKYFTKMVVCCHMFRNYQNGISLHTFTALNLNIVEHKKQHETTIIHDHHGPSSECVRCFLLSMAVVAVVSLIWLNGRSLLLACGRLG